MKKLFYFIAFIFIICTAMFTACNDSPDAATVIVTDIPELNILNFVVSDNTKTYNESPQGAVVVYSGEGIDTNTAGNIFIYYTGINGTDYAENESPPTNAGTYDILVCNAGGTIYAPIAKTVVGTLTINKAKGSFVPTGAVDIIFAPMLALTDAALPDGYAWINPSTLITNAGSGQTFTAAYTDPSGNYEPAEGSITVNVAKGQGAAVDIPVLAARTQNSITVNTIIAASGQVVEYAISFSALPPNDWQNSPVFTSLNIGTIYYIFARAVGNNNYETGEASAGLSTSTLQSVSQEKFEYYWVNDHGSLVTSSGGEAAISIGDTLTFTALGEGYSVTQWHLNGINTGQSGNTFSFSGKAGGQFTIGLFVEKDGKLYNTNISVKVEVEIRSITIDMYSSSGTGWISRSSLRIIVNGLEIRNNVQVSTSIYSNTPLAQSYTNTYTFSVTNNSIVDIYFSAFTFPGGQVDLHDQYSFVIYYTDAPPSPAFYEGPLSGDKVGPASWSGSNALLFRVRGSAPDGLLNEADGALLGSFTVVTE